MRFWRWSYFQNENNVMRFVISVELCSFFLNWSPFLIRYVIRESDKSSFTDDLPDQVFTENSFCVSVIITFFHDEK